MYKHHHKETLLILTIFVSMSRRRPIYILYFTFIITLENTSSFAYFLKYVLLILDDNVDEECDQFLK